MNLEKMMKEKIERNYPEANPEVIEFILDFNWRKGTRTPEEQEVIRSQFRSGYCYYFAVILQTAFNRGEICWCAPYGHICWVDIDGIPYDIEGVCESSCEYYIPVSYIKEGLTDFMHVPGKEFGASEQYISDAIERYVTHMGI